MDIKKSSQTAFIGSIILLLVSIIYLGFTVVGYEGSSTIFGFLPILEILFTLSYFVFFWTLFRNDFFRVNSLLMAIASLLRVVHFVLGLIAGLPIGTYLIQNYAMFFDLFRIFAILAFYIILLVFLFRFMRWQVKHNKDRAVLNILLIIGTFIALGIEILWILVMFNPEVTMRITTSYQAFTTVLLISDILGLIFPLFSCLFFYRFYRIVDDRNSLI